MKIRMGFVSNSSSSSFCIIGWQLDDENILKQICKHYIKEDECDSATPSDLWDIISGEKYKKLNLDVISIWPTYDNNGKVFGVNVTKTDDGKEYSSIDRPDLSIAFDVAYDLKKKLKLDKDPLLFAGAFNDNY